MLVNRLALRDDDRGSMLVSVLVITLVLSLVALTSAVVVANTTQSVVGTRSTLQAQAAADAGLADIVAKARRATSGVCDLTAASSVAPRYDVTAVCPPSSNTVQFTSTGRGEDGGVAVLQASYAYSGSVQMGVPDGAVHIGGGSISTSSFVLDGNGNDDASAVLVSGDFSTCNSTTRLDADLVLLSGDLNLTNACTFDRDVYVSGKVEGSAAAAITGMLFARGDVNLRNSSVQVGGITSMGNVLVHGHVTGSIKAKGDVTLQGGARVDGDVTAGGSLLMNDAEVRGSVSAAGTGSHSVFNAKIGSITVAGKLQSFQKAAVTRGIVSTRPGVSNSIAPDVTVGTEGIRLAGTLSTDGSPSFLSRTWQNVTGLVAPAPPTIVAPTILDVTEHRWEDFDFSASDWEALGYRVVAWPATKCDFQQPMNNTNVAAISALASPTVVDLRACSSANFYNVQLALKTDVLLLLPDAGSEHNFQSAKITSSDGQPHGFSIMIPDRTKNGAPTCVTPKTKINLYLASLGSSPMISGIVYTPCALAAGASGTSAGWNGQFYVGAMQFTGSGSPYTLVYAPTKVPGFGVASSTPPVLGSLLSRRDVP